MYHELIERLAVVLAKGEGWEVQDINGDNPRMKIYLKMTAACLGEIDNYLEEQKIEFGDLEVSSRYQIPEVLN